MVATLLFVFVLFSRCSVKCRKLVAAHVVFRHGNRTAIATCPNNPFKGWNDKLGQLTNVGKMTEYNLGQEIKSRYWKTHSLIRQKYFPDEVTIRSSPIDRCLVSAEIQAAGMYPPSEDEIWNNMLFWHPIPIRSTRDGEDYLLRNFDIDCPVMKELQNDVMKSPSYIELEARFKDIAGLVSDSAGKKYTLENLWQLNDLLKTQLENNIVMPRWASQKFMDEISQIVLEHNRLFFHSDNLTLKRFTGGYLLYKIVKDLQRIKSMMQKGSLIYHKDDQEVSKKLSLYSTHEITMIELMNVLDIPFNKSIPYGASISVELYDDPETGYVVEVYMRTNAGDFQNVPIKRCVYPCSLDNFNTKFKDLFVTDLKKECTPKIHKRNYLGGFVFFLVFSALLMLAIILILMFRPIRTISEVMATYNE